MQAGTAKVFLDADDIDHPVLMPLLVSLVIHTVDNMPRLLCAPCMYIPSPRVEHIHRAEQKTGLDIPYYSGKRGKPSDQAPGPGDIRLPTPPPKCQGVAWHVLR